MFWNFDAYKAADCSAAFFIAAKFHQGASSPESEVNMIKQSNFSRTLANEAKLGAYYTDRDHCRRIGALFSFPDKFCVLEPSIGDGSAVKEVIAGADGGSLFGVEVNEKTAASVNERGICDFFLQADFLKGVKISNKVFSFCFSNPPYGVDADGKKRLEQEFVEKTFSYITVDGIYVLVIPYYVLTDERFSKCYMARFNPLAVYRFDDQVYQNFKQIVVVGKRRESLGYLKSSYERWYETINVLEKLPYLPMEEPANKILVPESNPDAVEYFTTLKFDAEKAAKKLVGSPVYDLIGKFRMRPYTATSIGQPPVPLKKDLLYLCAVSGGGQGLVGNEKDGDLHLQRGEARIVKNTRCEVTEAGKPGHLVESSGTKIVLNIIENDGTITSLE